MSMFGELIADISKAINIKTEEEVKRIINQGLIPETPVRTGFLVGNWNYDKTGNNYTITNTTPYAGYVNNYNGFVGRGLERVGHGGKSY